MARVGQAAKRFPEVAAAQKQLGGDSKWASMLTPQPPGILPAGAPGVAQDVTAYDNLVALVENGSGSGGGQIYIGSLVRCGQVWRPIDVPQVMGEGGEIAGADGFFSPQAGSQSPAAEGPAQDERLKPLMTKLQDIENKMAGTGGSKRKELAVADGNKIYAKVTWNRTMSSTGDIVSTITTRHAQKCRSGKTKAKG